ncbi:NADH-quinone oxidoreductase subunit N [Prevotella sp. E9-3]|uniref:NADH-quinone oxidoreductase subunit N n=1 Tax=Prevotella sp. E9-3 TaxID=2913621 RepID=UPI001EDB89BC|nr:NADH-quinone oxidoreductase subunit N [Prevotella sp. E9-3]UKK47214.1 NADH-quinone oxidoreductase subunit N [Prevotella sp. E9-3]
MNYNQFFNMIPEAFLVLSLVLVFLADFCLAKSERKNSLLSKLTAALLLVTACVSSTVEPAEAFGGIYVTSQMVNVMKAILTVGTFIVVVMAQTWLKTIRLEGEFYMLVLSTLLGMYMMMSAGSFLMFFLGLEMASVPMACMVAFDKQRKNSAEGAAKYILLATFSSGVMLFGISFIYAATGSLYFDNVAAQLSVLSSQFSALTVMGLVFFFSGLGFKISLVPFHFWTADTYQGAPTPVTGYLSVVSKGAAALTLCIILTKVFGSMVDVWNPMLWIVIVLSITVANLFAIRQNELKRFMAFSSISQAGYIMLAVIGADAQAGATALTFYVLVYVVANMAVFTVISSVEHNGGSTEMSAYNGLYQTNPKLAFLMTLALFSLAGIPPFAGMFSKFFVFLAAVRGHEVAPFWPYFVVFIALINTVVSLYYYLLIVKAMYITKEEHPLPTFATDGATKLSLVICTAGICLFGICSCIYEWIAGAAL